jgi:hypothetical protein
MTDKINEMEENSTKEKLEGIAQVVIGEIESLGGVITGDPVTSAEGDFNVQVGTLHQESAEALDNAEEHRQVESPTSDQQTETTE